MSQSFRFDNNKYLNCESVAHGQKNLKYILGGKYTSYKNENIKIGRLYLQKRNGVVQVLCAGDAINLPIGQNLYIDDIDIAFAPALGDVYMDSFNNKSYILLRICTENGKVRAYIWNYGYAITSATNCGFSGSYVASNYE